MKMKNRLIHEYFSTLSTQSNQVDGDGDDLYETYVDFCKPREENVEYFSKLLGARVRKRELSYDVVKDLMEDPMGNPLDPLPHCYSGCAYYNVCGVVPDDILLSDGCTCSIRDEFSCYSVVEKIYPAEKVKDLNKTLFEITDNAGIDIDEKLELIETVINLTYMEYLQKDKREN